MTFDAGHPAPAVPALGLVMFIGPGSATQSVAQATNADESACMAVVPGRPGAGANCAHKAIGTIASMIMKSFLISLRVWRYGQRCCCSR